MTEPGDPHPDRTAGLLHDLRDALSTISAATLLLRSADSDADRASYLTAIETAVAKMDALSHLVAAERRAGDAPPALPLPADPKSVSLGALAEQIRATLAVRCAAAGLSFGFTTEPGLPALARIDTMRLARVLDNLIANAAAATRGRVDGCVAVDIGSQGDSLVISVRDTGPGLGPDPERWFARGVSGTASHSGLGLWVARRSAAAMNATLRAANGEEGGAIFTLEIPAALAAEGAEVGEGAWAPVLVVDGKPVGRAFMRAILANLDAEVVLAGGMAEALTLAAERPFVLAITDVRLPDGEGRELARRLRAIQPGLRVVATTGGTSEASAAIAEGLFAGLLQKPIDPRALGRLLSETRGEDAPSGR